MIENLAQAIETVVEFRQERDWKQFHTPRQLAAALSIEAAELQESFLWKSDDETSLYLRSKEGRAHAAEELADVLIYTLLLCHDLEIDPLQAIENKIAANATKYPVELSRSTAAKYTELHARPNQGEDK